MHHTSDSLCEALREAADPGTLRLLELLEEACHPELLLIRSGAVLFCSLWRDTVDSGCLGSSNGVPVLAPRSTD